MTDNHHHRQTDPVYDIPDADAVEIITINNPDPDRELLIPDKKPSEQPGPRQQAVPIPPANIWAEHTPAAIAASQNSRDTTREKPVLNDRISKRELCLTTHRLATLLQAGMPLVAALYALEEQLAGRPLAAVIRRAADQISAGSSFADALRQWPDIFSPLYINMVEAGQASGTLEYILEKLADNLEKRLELTARLKTALTYPAIMALTALAVVIFLMTAVIPGLTRIFTDMNHDLPWPTTGLIAVSAFLEHNLWPLLLALTGMILFGRLALKCFSLRRAWHRLLLNLPLIGPLLLNIEISRLSRTLNIMLAGGVPILDALTISRDIIQNLTLKTALDAIKQDIKAGAAVADAFKNTRLFPPIFHHMIAVGEMSGRLEHQFGKIADNTDSDINNSTRSLTAMAEPVILLIMGLVVGFIVLAILLPIFEINQML